MVPFRNFRLYTTAFEGLRVIERLKFTDNRGEFERLYCTTELKEVFGDVLPKQVNRSLVTKRGTVKGLHFQRDPYSETKLVTCIRGAVQDISLDLRKTSNSFGKHLSVILSPDNARSVLIPAGFAHGFQALADDTELIYFHTEVYHPTFEGGVNSLDPALGIKWSLEICCVSQKDSDLPLLKDLVL